MTSLLLDILALLTVVAAVFVITARSPVVSVMFLIAVFVLAACYLVCLGVTFVGLSYLIVYVGAVAVLFLFVVMMLNVRLSEVTAAGHEYTKSLPLGALVGSLFLYELLTVVPTPSTSAGELTLSLLSRVHGAILGVNGSSTSGDTVHLAFTTESADVAYSVVSQVQALGLSLYTYGSLWLLVTSVILLLAMMGPIALCLRSRTQA